jgi:peptidase E
MSEERVDKEGVTGSAPTGEDRQRRLRTLKRKLIAAAGGPTRELSLEEVRKKGLLAVLRKQAGKKSIKSFEY